MCHSSCYRHKLPRKKQGRANVKQCHFQVLWQRSTTCRACPAGRAAACRPQGASNHPPPRRSWCRRTPTPCRLTAQRRPVTSDITAWRIPPGVYLLSHSSGPDSGTSMLVGARALAAARSGAAWRGRRLMAWVTLRGWRPDQAAPCRGVWDGKAVPCRQSSTAAITGPWDTSTLTCTRLETGHSSSACHWQAARRSSSV